MDEVDPSIDRIGRDGKVGTTDPSSTEHAALVESIRQVAGKAALRAAEIDAARSFPSDLYAEVRASGAFHALAPKEFGGLAVSLAVINDIVAIAARGNGSLGWLMMVGVAQGPGYGMLPKPTAVRLLAQRPVPTIRGAIAPKGIAVPATGGFIVSGRWPFVSGGPDPDYIGGNCIVFNDGKPSIDAAGAPEAVMCLLPAHQAEFLDTWHVLGMRGTDSCDVVVKESFVPSEMTYNIFSAKSFFDTPHARLPVRVAYSTPHAALALGIARGALDDITELAGSKRPSMHPASVLADDPVFRHQLGENALRLSAGRAFLDQVTAQTWAAGLEKREMSSQEIMTARTMSAFVTGECVKVVDWAFTTAGSHSVYDTSSLQRRLRDIHVATQHAAVHLDGYRVLGGAILGDRISLMELF